VDSGTSVSLDHSAYVLESGELLILARTISAGSMGGGLRGDGMSETNMPPSMPFFAL
jgi:hypothetical protein